MNQRLFAIVATLGVIVGCSQQTKTSGSGKKQATEPSRRNDAVGARAALTEKGFFVAKGDVELSVDDKDEIKSPVSTFIIQILGEDASPAVGATLTVIRLDGGSKSALRDEEAAAEVETEAPIPERAPAPEAKLSKLGKAKIGEQGVSMSDETSNIFTIMIAAGRDYEIVVKHPTLGGAHRTLTFDTTRPVDVSFPLTLMANAVEGEKADWSEDKDQDGYYDDSFVKGGLKFCDTTSGDRADDMNALLQVLKDLAPKAYEEVSVKVAAASGAIVDCNGLGFPRLVLSIQGSGKSTSSIQVEAPELKEYYSEYAASDESKDSESEAKPEAKPEAAPDAAPLPAQEKP